MVDPSREGCAMAKYLLQVNYTADGVKGVLKAGGTARQKAAAHLIESVGGTLDAMYFAFGSTDVYCIADMPTPEAAAAAALTVSGSGAATVVSTVLLTPDQIDAASDLHADYAPPGS
jgi:uncharacterized protein with GYD domain